MLRKIVSYLISSSRKISIDGSIYRVRKGNTELEVKNKDAVTKEVINVNENETIGF